MQYYTPINNICVNKSWRYHQWAPLCRFGLHNLFGKFVIWIHMELSSVVLPILKYCLALKQMGIFQNACLISGVLYSRVMSVLNWSCWTMLTKNIRHCGNWEPGPLTHVLFSCLWINDSTGHSSIVPFDDDISIVRRIKKIKRCLNVSQ